MDNLSFKELVRKVHQNDEYFNIIVTKYFTEDLKLNEEEAKKSFSRLIKYNDVYNDFTKYITMKKFDFNIKRKGIVFVKVDDRVDDFLQQAKENGYRFGNGKTITLKSDEKSFHYAVTEDNKLFRLSTQCWLFVDKVDRLVY